jgi:hypothetical protein
MQIKRFVKYVMALSLVVTSWIAIAKATGKYLDVSFQLITPLTLHEPVLIDVSIVNGMSYGITVDLGFRRENAFTFSIIDPSAKRNEFEREHSGIDVTEPLYLSPKEKYSSRLFLNGFYPFDDVGTYRIIIKSELPIIIGKTKLRHIASENESDRQMEETILDLTILPRNMALLDNKCRELLRLIQQTDGEEQQKYLKELSYIKDPIAIPYLTDLVAEKHPGSALKGLMSIGTDEAYEGMIAVSQSQYDKYTADYAKSLLRQKAPEIKNDNIRNKIITAIAK